MSSAVESAGVAAALAGLCPGAAWVAGVAAGVGAAGAVGVAVARRRSMSARARGGRGSWRGGGAAALDVGARARERLADVAPEIQVERLLDQDALHAQRRAPQPERILGPRRLLPDGEDAGEGVELVGDGEREAGARGGQLIAGRPRQVVLADRRGHLVRLTVRLRVVGTHDALQLGELAHHGGEQIALAQLRGAQRVLA